ncbi:MAG: efflux RND transporter periplasmic adaptor subunit [Firmicutes bacterium]|nr:efflux RND transporter periplasmic adaptor subunit [Bacillota bacterium]MCM1400853.1 efflux RND transporter periplasmic adaptor subunit [Bacteroides sp.]MCM1476645.1 efflux RND transporter periplasmic adaptor subunit [Bacteroides sp.]
MQCLKRNIRKRSNGYNWPVVIPLLAFAILFGCKKAEHNELAHHHDAEQEAQEHKHGNAEIILEPEQAQKFGVKVDTLQPQEFNSALRVTGQLFTSPSCEAVVSATTAGVLKMSTAMTPGGKVSAGQQVASITPRSATGDNPNAQANAAINAAKRELDRLKPLLDDGIATIAEYNAALANYESAKSTFSRAAASGTVTSPISGTVTQLLANTGQFVETGTPLARISSNTQLILRADVPESMSGQLHSITMARIKLPENSDWVSLANLNGHRIDNTDMPVVSGYTPLFFSFRNNGDFSAGSYVDVELTGGTPTSALLVPEQAIVEQQGSKYVFVKVSDHGYEKRLVNVGNSSGGYVEITGGLAAGDAVVIAGASVVKMAETSGNVPQGHTHNH